MKLPKLFIASITVVFLITIIGTGLAQNFNFVERFGQILKEAGCPLSEEQIKQLNELPAGPESRQKMMGILGEEQREALSTRFRNRQPRNQDQISQQRNRVSGAASLERMSQIFRDAGCQLSEEQIKQIRELPPGPESQKKMMEILNEDQRKALENSRETRGSESRFVQFIVPVLEQAGCPLSEEQIKQLRELPPGPEARQKMMEMLTEEQRKALENSRGNRRR